VVDDGGESYMLYTLCGVPRSSFGELPMPRNTAIFGPTFEGAGPVRLDDVTTDARYGLSGPYFGMPEGHPPVRSYLAVPVVARDGEVRYLGGWPATDGAILPIPAGSHVYGGVIRARGVR